MTPGLAGWRLFISRGTLISAALAIIVWGLAWGPVAGAWVVLLLYAHEIGHVLAAVWRRVPVERAPIFLPGLGAFVQVRPGASAWDEALIFCGGPLLGGLAALAAKWAGLRWGVPALAFAGDFCLLVNLGNLAPFRPLDGGHIVAHTRWLGFALALLLGALTFVPAVLTGFRSWPGLLPTSIIVVGLLWAWAAARQRAPSAPLHTRLGILGLYLALCVGLALAFTRSGRANWRPFMRQDWLAVFDNLLLVALLLGLAYLLITDRWSVPILLGRAAAAIGLPGARWLERLAGFLARRGDIAAGTAVAFGYDALSKRGRGEEDAWLERLTPLLQAAGPEAVNRAFGTMLTFGARPYAWLVRSLPRVRPEELSLVTANNLGYSLLRVGHAAEGLPFARRATEMSGKPVELAYAHGTLGSILLELGIAGEAEEHLRRALDTIEHAGNRLELAQALAAQGRYPAAVTETERVVRAHGRRWPTDLPDRAAVDGWLANWRGAGSDAALRPAPAD